MSDRGSPEQGRLLFYDQCGRLHRMPVCLHIFAHIRIGIILAVYAPHNFIFAKALAIDDQVSRLDLAEIYTAIVGQTNLDLKTCDLSVLFNIAESRRLNYLCATHYRI